ncbi:PREDICTED: TNF receptor-associated factor 5-like [Amphimedon queenslandica]|uniref:RING-type domain-containing protein n=1 Tax=Amphimedon queenslandica TaxID=400682 RepID=A0AAN0J880_AMPQE|nr:PREDICTED: TNF receptor-associated factor 5-like [Amphimedon queenslandica]|eukprot:XP_019853230.1 PREDICTED: TNF receptor-associated factor 5-like [Amphimedon queenslandica]
MAQLSKKELFLVKELPEHLDIECPVCLNILTDPHLVSCCGNHFCGPCIERVRASNRSCPMCKEKEYQAMADKKCSRIINGLEVYCSNKEKGCQWKGELKNMSTHLNKEMREGECQYEGVKCRYEKCQESKQRRYLKYHEDEECLQCPFQCQYCSSKGTFLSITKDHYEEYRQYPVTCLNKCDVPQASPTAHVEPVDCVFSEAGCNDNPSCKSVHVHTADTKHRTLLAGACGQSNKENEKIKEELKENSDKIKEMKKDIEPLKEEDAHFNNDCVRSTSADDSYLLLPVVLTLRSGTVHFYTSACGQHMSARVMEGCFLVLSELGSVTEYLLLLAFHKGNFDELKPKLPTIFAAFRDKDTPLIH